VEQWLKAISIDKEPDGLAWSTLSKMRNIMSLIYADARGSLGWSSCTARTMMGEGDGGWQWNIYRAAGFCAVQEQLTIFVQPTPFKSHRVSVLTRPVVIGNDAYVGALAGGSSVPSGADEIDITNPASPLDLGNRRIGNIRRTGDRRCRPAKLARRRHWCQRQRRIARALRWYCPGRRCSGSVTVSRGKSDDYEIFGFHQSRGCSSDFSKLCNMDSVGLLLYNEILLHRGPRGPSIACQPQRPVHYAVLISVPLCISLLGIAVATGLLRLKEWARRTCLFLATVPVLGCAILVIIDPPRENSFDIPPYIIGLLVILIPISLWWWILFAREGVRVQFRPDKADRSMRRISGMLDSNERLCRNKVFMSISGLSHRVDSPPKEASKKTFGYKPLR